jgi:hypothetical protein
MRPACCDRQSFQRLTKEISPLCDPGSAEGVEFTVGRCANCKKLLMACWVGAASMQGFEDIDQAFLHKLSGEQDPQLRKRMLADWFNSLD